MVNKSYIIGRVAKYIQLQKLMKLNEESQKHVEENLDKIYKEREQIRNELHKNAENYEDVYVGIDNKFYRIAYSPTRADNTAITEITIL